MSNNFVILDNLMLMNDLQSFTTKTVIQQSNEKQLEGRKKSRRKILVSENE